jgi:hypothetical protein
MLLDMHRRLISIACSALAAAVVGGVLIAGTGASAAPAAHKAKGGAVFRHALAAKLGAQLDKPADEVLAALKSSGKARKDAAKGEKQKAWTDSVAKALKVEPEAVTKGVQALVKERLDSLVQDGWLTAEQRDKRLAKGKLGVGFLRIR